MDNHKNASCYQPPSQLLITRDQISHLSKSHLIVKALLHIRHFGDKQVHRQQSTYEELFVPTHVEAPYYKLLTHVHLLLPDLLREWEVCCIESSYKILVEVALLIFEILGYFLLVDNEIPL